MRYRNSILTGLAAAAIIGTAALAFAQTSTVIIAPSAPPALRSETVPPPPAPGTQIMAWQAGHWVWSGAAWAWDEGHYAAAPQAVSVWEPGHWAQQPGGGYAWVDGNWRG